MPFAQHDFFASFDSHAAFSVVQEVFFDFLFFFFFFFLSSFLSSIVVSALEANTVLLDVPRNTKRVRIKNSFFMINSLDN